MSKLKFFYGFIILVLLASGFYGAYVGGLFPNMTLDAPVVKELGYEDLIAIAGKGIDASRRGTRSIREIIAAYDLSKAEFYETLKIPEDYPDTKTVLEMIGEKIVNSKDVQEYLTPIVENFSKPQ
jgi:hypothetical protein